MRSHFTTQNEIITLRDSLAQSAGRYPNKPVVITDDATLSYQELFEKATALSKMLVDMSIQPGSCVGYALPKAPELLIGIYGIILSGSIFFPIDPHQVSSGLEKIFELTKPDAIICQPEYLDRFSKLKFAPKSDRVILSYPKKGDRFHFEGLTRYMNSHIPLPVINPYDPVYLNFTSGTTGVPKGAVTTHANIFCNTTSAIQALGLTKDDIHMCMFPPFVHPHDIFSRAVQLGGSLVMVDSIKPKTIASTLENHKVTSFMAVSSIYETLIRLRDLETRKLENLRVAESGGMYVSSTLNKAFKSKTGINITNVWGSTETTGIALAAPVDDDFPLQSMGRPCPNYDVRVVDHEGRDLPPFEIGEMLVSGPGVCSRYYNNPTESKKYIEGDTFHTGDLVYKDDQGYIYFQARTSGMLKVGGMRVYPAEVEEVIRAHPQILEVVVVKENADLHGEVPKAVIVPKNGYDISKGELRKYCSQHLNSYKIPRIVEFVRELPRTKGGKIAFNEL